MLWTRILGDAVPSCSSEYEDTLVWNPDDLGSSNRKMVLYIVLELRGIPRLGILGVDTAFRATTRASNVGEDSVGYM